ncbi:hypothetical protein AALB16_07060 [Lachnospiraceae bacterium 62-35]
MDFMSIQSIGSYTKTLKLQMKWEKKKQSGEFTASSMKPIGGAGDGQSGIVGSDSDTKGDEKLKAIQQKLYSGKKLSQAELEYLQQKDPIAYQRAKIVAQEQASYEKELKRCRTKEEVQRLKLSRAAASLAAVNEVKNNPNIKGGEKLKAILFEQQKMAAVEKATNKFVKSGKYAQLPTEAEKIKAEKDMKEAEEAEREEAKASKKEEEQLPKDGPSKEEESIVPADVFEEKGEVSHKAAGLKKADFHKTSEDRITRIEAEQTPEAHKVRKSKARGGYLADPIAQEQISPVFYEGKA